MPQPLEQTARDERAGALLSARRPFVRPSAPDTDAAGSDLASPAPDPGPTPPAPEDRSPSRLVRAAGPGLAVVLMTAGLLPMAHAVAGSRDGGAGSSDQIWWVVGLALVYLPAALAVTWPGLRSPTRLVLAVSAAFLLQVGQVVLVTTGPGASGSPYVGLATATDAVRSLTGLAADTSTAVVLLAARLVLAFAVLLVVTRLTGSVRIGAGALVVYVGQPQLSALDPRTAPVALALPLAVLVVYLVFQRREGHRLSLLPALLTAVAVSLVDGITAALLVVTLATWAVVEALVQRRDRAVAPAVVALVTLGASGAVLVRSGTGVRAVLDAAATSAARPGSWPWETTLVVVSVVLTLVVLLPALWRARRLLEVRVGLVLVLLLTALLYPLVLAGLVLEADGLLGAVVGRAAGFVLLGVGFVVAWWFWQHRVRWWMALPLALGATAVFLGSVLVSAGPVRGQLPAPASVADAGPAPDDTSAASGARPVVDAEAVAAADWLRTNLPAGSVVLVPRLDGVPASSYGDLRVVDRLGPDLDTAGLILDPPLSAADRAALRAGDVRYVVADIRRTSGTQPVSRSAVRTFSSLAGVDIVYDGGSILVLDLGAAR